MPKRKIRRIFLFRQFVYIFFKRSFYFVNIHFGFYTPKAIKQMIQMKSLWITSWDYQNYSKWWFERQLPSATFFEAIQRECIRILISMKMTTTVTATCSRFDTTIHIAYIRFVLFALTLMLCDRQCNDAFSVLLFVDFLFYIVFHICCIWMAKCYYQSLCTLYFNLYGIHMFV